MVSQDSLFLFPEVSLRFIVFKWESCHFSKISPYISILPDPGRRGQDDRSGGSESLQGQSLNGSGPGSTLSPLCASPYKVVPPSRSYSEMMLVKFIAGCLALRKCSAFMLV